MRILLYIITAAAVVFTTAAAGASENASDSKPLKISGYLQAWWIIAEMNENGLREPFTHEDGSDEASGFQMHRARIMLEKSAGSFDARLSIRCESSPIAVFDAYMAFPLWSKKTFLVVGQQKIPSTYEVAAASSELDFITRSTLSASIADWALSRSPMLSAPRFNGVQTFLRDFGVSLKGVEKRLSYHAMISNGLGANRFVGAFEKKQEIWANDFGAYFYGLRLEYDFFGGKKNASPPLFSKLVVGAHASRNSHDNMILDDEGTVIDLKRSAWSIDGRLEIKKRIRFTAMYGGGVTDDDFDADDKTDYTYTGWELKCMAVLVEKKLEAGVRWESYGYEYSETGDVDYRKAFTIGLTYWYGKDVRIRLNYKWKVLESASDPDIDDDSLILAAQFRF